MRNQPHSWYRRTFRIPTSWAGKRVLLHFGAVTYQATAYVNGVAVGSHRGSYDAFTFDITAALKPGENELLVDVYDPMDAGDQPMGKQRPASGAEQQRGGVAIVGAEIVV